MNIFHPATTLFLFKKNWYQKFTHFTGQKFTQPVLKQTTFPIIAPSGTIHEGTMREAARLRLPAQGDTPVCRVSG